MVNLAYALAVTALLLAKSELKFNDNGLSNYVSPAEVKSLTKLLHKDPALPASAQTVTTGKTAEACGQAELLLKQIRVRLATLGFEPHLSNKLIKLLTFTWFGIGRFILGKKQPGARPIAYQLHDFGHIFVEEMAQYFPETASVVASISEGWPARSDPDAFERAPPKVAKEVELSLEMYDVNAGGDVTSGIARLRAANFEVGACIGRTHVLHEWFEIERVDGDDVVLKALVAPTLRASGPVIVNQAAILPQLYPASFSAPGPVSGDQETKLPQTASTELSLAPGPETADDAAIV